MRHTVYRTTNTVNGKIYIGAHATQDPHDSYLGSGSAITAAIKKYGRAAFVKEVLFDFDTRKEMLDKERELVPMEFCLREDTYNLKVGGRYGTLSPAARKKLSESGREAQNRPEVL